MRLTHADEGLQVTHGDGHAMRRCSRLPQLYVHPLDLVVVCLLQLRPAVLLGVGEVLAQQVLAQHVRVTLWVVRGPLLCILFQLAGVVAHVAAHDEFSEPLILDGVHLVPDDTHDVKARQNGVRQLHVLCEGLRGIVAAAHGVGSCYDRAARLQLRDDACFADADALLLHGLMDGHPVLVIHLVELIDEAHPLVCQHQGAALQGPLLGHGIPVH
mmetsp:Transcript_21527/g.59642  ORF Transcript_21527/g.59642 Transcript_21527/m.59642 type:complete len:214 (-) Transcript_21527:1726-2367(-)